MLPLFFSTMVFAVPQQLSQQGRLLDTNGNPVDGVHNLTFQIFESPVSTNSLWVESISVTFNNGYYAVVIGTDSSNPLDSDLLDQSSLFLELQLDTEAPMVPRQKLSSVPYAKRADVAKNVDGGVVNATEISINGNVVLDGTGSFVGQTTPQWSDIQNIPNGFSDGVDDDSDSLADISCIDDGMVLTYNGGMWNCGYDLVLDSADVVAMIESEADLTLTLGSGSTVNGERIQTGTEQDSLAEKVCSDGQILVYNMNLGSWDCGVDSDTTLTSSEVKSMIEAMSGLALQGDATVGGKMIITTPPSCSDGQILSFDESGQSWICVDFSAGPTCTQGQIQTYNESTQSWECSEFASVLDLDGDGVLGWNDCDDNDGDLGAKANDADCDGILTADDCDDTNASSTVVAHDADCDGVLTADDCDDEDETVFDVESGLSETCAPASCKSILVANYSTGDGVYWINPNNSGAFQAYCDMTSNGGGWTLILKSLNNNSELYYNSSYWTTTTLLNESDFNLSNTTNSKYASFNNLPFTEMRVFMNGIDRSFTFSSQQSSVLDVINSGDSLSSSPNIAGQNPSPSYWNFPIQGHESYICKNFGINHDFYGSGGIARLGYQSSQEFPCGHPGTSEGVGLWARDHNDNLGSGRLLHDTEPNSFATALVYVR